MGEDPGWDRDRRRRDDYERGRRDGETLSRLAAHDRELRELELGLGRLQAQVSQIATRDEVREAITRAVQLGSPSTGALAGYTRPQRLGIQAAIVSVVGGVIVSLGHTLGAW